ncbi:Hypothetical Protein XCAW_01642 [Xanthomonas citri subsp. citri Aw12879]|nr:Hypothetical Protein XCAW_01642 [Xanthomonas citri subsp. citri Aw12879]
MSRRMSVAQPRDGFQHVCGIAEIAFAMSFRSHVY